MRTFLPVRPLLAAALIGLMAPAASALAPAPAKDPHHVMWTSKKGKAKCTNKATKEKAERCAAKLREHNATNVQVMAGKCNAM